MNKTKSKCSKIIDIMGIIMQICGNKEAIHSVRRKVQGE